MIIGVPVELYLHERRVALVPAIVPVLTKIGMKVLVEHGAGEKAGFADSAYEEQGAGIAPDRAQLAYSEPNRPAIPKQTGHPFRSKPATVTEQIGHPQWVG